MLDRKYDVGSVESLQRLPQYFVIPERPAQPGISLRVLPQEEELKPGGAPRQAILTVVLGRVANANQTGNLVRESQHDGESNATVAPAPTIQIHAPIQDESIPHEACNFETGTFGGYFSSRGLIAPCDSTKRGSGGRSDTIR